MASKRVSRRAKSPKLKSSHDFRPSRQSGSLDYEDIIGEPNVTLTLTGSLKADIAAVSKYLSMTYVPEVRPMEQPAAVKQSKTSFEKGDKVALVEPVDRQKTTTIKSFAKMTVTQAPPTRGKSPLRDRGKSMMIPAAEATTISEALNTLADFLPGTAESRPTSGCLKPCLLVDMTNEDDHKVTSLSISGWKVDRPIWTMLQMVLPQQVHLHTLRLWRVGINDEVESFEQLIHLLSTCPSVTNLTLDSNRLTHLPVGELVSPGCQLRHLSLRFCELDDAAASRLSERLGLADAPNRTLLTLTLTGNRITDVGAGALADALKVNRTLRALNLTANAIGDEGCQQLAEALSWYPLTGFLEAVRRRLVKDELQQIESRKSLMAVPGLEPGARGSQHQRKYKKGQQPKASSSEKNQALGSASLTAGNNTAVASSKKPASSRSVTTPAKTSRKLMAASRQQSESKGTAVRLKTLPPESERTRSASVMLHHADGGEEPPQPMVGGGASLFLDFRPARFSATDLPVPAWGESSPLLSGGYVRGDAVWLPGNRALLSLNLSRNRVSEKGLTALLTALEDQQEEREYRLQQRLLQLSQPLLPPADLAYTSRRASRMSRSGTHKKASVKPALAEVQQQQQQIAEPPETDLALPDKGLLRLVLTGNLFKPETSPCFARLQELLQSRDPLQVLQCGP